MKNKTTQLYDQKTQEFITKQTDKEILFLELIVFTIVAVVLIRWVGRVLVAVYSRAVFINKPGYQKAAWTKDTQHLFPKRP